MGELVVPILAEVAKPMVEVLVRRISQEIHLFWGFEKELKKLEHKITVVGTVLGSTDGNMVSGEAPKVWLRNLIHIIYKTEDMFDVLAYEKHRGVVMKRRAKKAFKGKMRLTFAPVERVIFRSEIGRLIRSITGDFEDALKEANEIVQLKNAVQSAASASISTLPTDTKMNNDKLLHHVRQYVDMSIFIGRESDVFSVVDKLCNPAHWDSQSISSNHRISEAQEKKIAVTKIPEQIMLSEVQRMVEEMQNLNKQLEDMENDMNEYFKPIDKDVEALMNLQMEKDKATAEMMGSMYKQALLEKAETQGTDVNGDDQEKTETTSAMFEQALVQNSKAEVAAEVKNPLKQTK